jgi:hypothetical protein
MTIIDHQYIDKWATDVALTTMSDMLTKYRTSRLFTVPPMISRSALSGY